jgi:shikimate kinase
MGTGKSSVGRLLARRLRFDFVDTDAWIEKQAGQGISEVFAQQGEAAFWDRERRVMNELAQCERTVISTGGGLGASADVANLKQREPVHRTADALVHTAARSSRQVAQHALHELRAACPQLTER